MCKKGKNHASAIIPYNGGLMLMQRIKGIGEEKREYYTIPGGGQEEGETIEQATIREVKEELGIDIEITKNVYVIENSNRTQYFYISKYISGEIGTGNGPEITNVDYNKYGEYNPKVIKKEMIKDINLVPLEIKEIILKDIEKIFSVI